MDKSQKAVRVYDQIASSYANIFSKPSSHLDKFLELLPSPAKILDVGCGTGTDSNFVASKGHQVVGVDLSEEMLNIAKSSFPQIDFRLEDMRDIDFSKNQFDGIIASCSLIHIPKKDVPKTLRQFSKLLKPKGIIYLQLQSGPSEEVFVKEPFKPDEKLFLNIISLDEIKKLLTGAGFRTVFQLQRPPKSKEELNYTKLYLIAQLKR